MGMRLSDKVAIITGTGAGIGTAIAQRFAEEGAQLVLNDIRDYEGAPAGAELVIGDIAQEETGKRLVETAIRRFGQIDIVVNNAANFTQLGLEQANLDDWQKVFSVNVFGPALLNKHAVPHMKVRRKGSIVNVASMSGVIAQPNKCTYNSSKGAMIMMTKCMALDLAPFGIRVNTVCPGCVETSATHAEAKREGKTWEQWSAEVAPLHMLGRVGQPVEIANPVLFLASDEASFITAATLMAEGGYTEW